MLMLVNSIIKHVLATLVLLLDKDQKLDINKTWMVLLLMVVYVHIFFFTLASKKPFHLLLISNTHVSHILAAKELRPLAEKGEGEFCRLKRNSKEVLDSDSYWVQNFNGI
jgi:hypothetical protein